MKKRLAVNWLCWLGWVMVAAALHLFGNQAGTLTVLISSAIIPPIFVLTAFFSKKKIEAQIQVPERGHAGETLTGALCVRHTGVLPMGGVRCLLRCENGGTGEKIEESLFLPTERNVPWGRQTQSVPFSFSSSHGGTLLFSAEVFAVPVFSLAFMRVKKQIRAHVLISSEVSPFNIPDPAETQAIREYLPGDPIRSIHWKLSQKNDKLMVREYGETTLETPLPAAMPDSGVLAAPQPENGLRFQLNPVHGTNKFHLFFGLLLAELLLLGLIGSLLDMAQRPDLWWTALPGVTLAAMGSLLFRRNKAFLRFQIAAGAGLLLACVLGWPLLLSGFGAFFNRLFALSEQHNAYLYDRFDVTETGWNIGFFLVLAGLVIAFLCILCVRRKNLFFAALPCLACFVVQIYLGVFSTPLWTIVLFFSFLLLASRSLTGEKTFRPTVSLVVLLAIIAAITLLAYTGPSQRLSTWSEAVRDQFGDKITAEELEGPGLSAGNDLNGNQDEHAEESEDGIHTRKETDGFLGAHIGAFQQIKNVAGPVLLLILAASVLCFVFWLFRRAMRMRKYRQQFDAPEISVAVLSMFQHMFAMLCVGELKAANVDYSDYQAQLPPLTDEAYIPVYQAAVALWQEAAFSEHRMTESQRAEMRGALVRTEQTLREHSGLWQKIKLSLFKTFGRSEGKV